MIVFKYKKEKGRNGRFLFRPVAEVGLVSNRQLVQASMYIDSGADLSLIPLSVGTALGFDKTGDIKEIKGIGGEAIPYIIKRIELLFPGGYKFSARIGWTLIEEVPLLLGRLDVFLRFRIIFNEAKQLITFEPHLDG